MGGTITTKTEELINKYIPAENKLIGLENVN